MGSLVEKGAVQNCARHILAILLFPRLGCPSYVPFVLSYSMRRVSHILVFLTDLMILNPDFVTVILASSI